MYYNAIDLRKSMINNNLDPVHLAKRVSDWSDFPEVKAWCGKYTFEWKFEKQNFGDCWKMFIDGAGAAVSLKAEEKQSNMEANVNIGEEREVRG